MTSNSRALSFSRMYKTFYSVLVFVRVDQPPCNTKLRWEDEEKTVGICVIACVPGIPVVGVASKMCLLPGAVFCVWEKYFEWLTACFGAVSADAE